MEIEELRKLAYSFFEWPTEDRTHVTLTSALLFAQHVLRMTQQQAEPVEYQRRMRPLWDSQEVWTPWEKCTKGTYDDCIRVPVLHDWEHQVRALYTAQQAQPAPITTGWNIEKIAHGYRIDSPDDCHLIVRHIYEAPSHYWENIVFEFCKAITSQQPAQPAPIPTAWQPIETAPEVKGDYFWCFIAWGPDGDQSTGIGFRWRGKWFAAGCFYRGGSGRQFEWQEIEVKPTHWQPLPPAPGGEG